MSLSTNFKIVLTPVFLKEVKLLAKKYPSIKEDIKELRESLQENPLQGVAIGHQLFKIRIKIQSKNHGKSGGGRIIALIRIVQKEIILLAIYDKSEKGSIPAQDIKRIAKAALDEI